ncbi:MAG: hypothetical protein HY465_03350 [Deltaproteobacteria bacterium]|nr:hypothetical protein [Deltaproteobacteria bacterium]
MTRMALSAFVLLAALLLSACPTRTNTSEQEHSSEELLIGDQHQQPPPRLPIPLSRVYHPQNKEHMSLQQQKTEAKIKELKLQIESQGMK